MVKGRGRPAGIALETAKGQTQRWQPMPQHLQRVNFESYCNWEADLTSEQLHPPQFTREERQSYARRLLAIPVALFLAVTGAYLGLLVLVLAAPMLVAVPLAVPCGVLIGMLFILGHDAAHNSFTRSRRLNLVIGRLAFLPSLHAYSLWDLSHNRTHHLHNNVRGVDYVWEPKTPAEFRAQSSARRGLYRFYRTPIGVAFYYLGVLWAPRLFIPWPFLIRRGRLVYWLDAGLVLGFLVLQTVGVTAIGAQFGHNAWTSVLTGMILPFLIWNGLMSFIIFFHHTHPTIGWFPDDAARTARMGALSGTARVVFPTPFRQLVLGIMEHSAHHYASGVPLYHLAGMQAALEAQGGILTWQFSWRAYARICRQCKLYDYDAARWVTFEDGARLL